MNITKFNECFLIVYVNDNIPIFVEKIVRDKKLWYENMLPILKQFYKECIAPEIVRGNLKKNKKCVDPPYILEEINKRKLTRK